MAFTNYGLHNYEVDVPLSIEYTSGIVPGSDVSGAPQYQYVRHASKAYRFKGMTEAAVKQCLADKRRQYVRRLMNWRWQNGRYIQETKTHDYFGSVATFDVNRIGAAPVYDLRIKIDEYVSLFDSRERDLTSATDIAGLEWMFTYTGGSQPYSYVGWYKYDEPEEFAT